MVLPIIMIVICLVGGGVAYFFIKKAEQNKYKDKNIPEITANEFTNVKDIGGNFLYGFKPIDDSALISAISKSIVQNSATADGAKDQLTRHRAEKAAEDGDKIMLQIDQNGETAGFMSISIMPIAHDEKTFTKVSRRDIAFTYDASMILL